MRKEVIINNGWYFTKEKQTSLPVCPKGWEKVSLPHTWNAYDGQDGGADYFRGECFYLKELEFSQILDSRLYYIEFGAVASQCKVYLNGQLVTQHKGGYSRFRANITPYIKGGKNILAVCADNSPTSDIYPQMADFTFYGGIHRSVKLIEVESTHFDLDFYGADGLEAYSDIFDEDDGYAKAILHLKSYVVSPQPDDCVRYIVYNGEGGVVAEVFCGADTPETTLELERVRLWQGIKNPYLYGVEAQIIRRNEVLDNVSISHGFRSFFVDSEKGFFLNGELTPLRGVSRHGDRHNKGLALSLEDHIRDAMLISEVGANTVRLAHYQHAEEFYELCDRYGFVVWAEIPFISKMNNDPEAHKNCILQMKELIYQNFNHPSICFWGISNEITIGGSSDTLVKNLNDLNDLVHSLDKTRITTMAQVSMLPQDDEQNQITDILAYNHYFGWYGGQLSDNEKWFDEFHRKYPDRAIGISEYGCEGIISYHNESPRMGDYSEEYQAKYHEHMLNLLHSRDWIWGSYVWNMFDFGCDARDEGGVSGRNNKGLVSFDRAIKKDSFYICKAYWSDEPFVHICSKRYRERESKKINIKVYSNCDSVSLYVNGKDMGSVEGKYVFEFTDVRLSYGINTITAKSGGLEDTTVVCRVQKEPEGFVLKEDNQGFVGNWFDGKEESDPGELTFNEGYYSIKNTIREILDSNEAGDILAHALSSIMGMNIKKSMLMIMSEQTPETMLENDQIKQKIGIESEKAIRLVNSELQKIRIKK